jgi:hypothetical protein
MNRHDIFEIWQYTQLQNQDQDWGLIAIKFAQAIARIEREQIARMCDDYAMQEDPTEFPRDNFTGGKAFAAQDLAEKIRAREDLGDCND